MSARAAVFLDRDGVLNRAILRDGKPYPPRRPEEVELLPGVRQACCELAGAGFALVMVTNQPDVARGTTPREWVDQVNLRLKQELGLDLVKVCPHDDPDGCQCRKPAPGLLLEAAAELGLDLSRSFMAGDRWRDVEAGKRAGCSSVWIRSDYAERSGADADFTAEGLLEAASWILAIRKNNDRGN